MASGSEHPSAVWAETWEPIRDCRAVDATQNATARPHSDPHGNGVRIGEAHTPAPKADTTDADAPAPAALRPLAPALQQLIMASAPMRNDGTYDMPEPERRAQGAIYRSITGGASATLPPPAAIPPPAAGIARGEAARPQFDSHGNGAHVGEAHISAPDADARSRSPPAQLQPRAKRRASELIAYEEDRMMDFLAGDTFREERCFSLHPVLAHELMMSAPATAPPWPPTPAPEPPSPPTAAMPPPAADVTASAEPPVGVGVMSNASARPHVDPHGNGVRIGEADTPAPSVGAGDDSDGDGAGADTQRKRPRRGARNWIAWERDSDDSSVTEADLMARAMAETSAGVAPSPSVPAPVPTPAPAQPPAAHRAASEAGGQVDPTPGPCRMKGCARPRRIRYRQGIGFPVGAVTWVCCLHCNYDTRDVDGVRVHTAECDALTELAPAPSAVHTADALTEPAPAPSAVPTSEECNVPQRAAFRTGLSQKEPAF